MNGDQDRAPEMVIQALHEWWMGMGEFAWVLLGILLVTGITMMLCLLRWIQRGDLSRHNVLRLCHRRRAIASRPARNS